ncbi:TetR family transcriptional regulator [Carbonactinospora thermoautotrophica]|uniref:Putative TetR-family transcriptional regulator n=1 Tax=Carbonactinospora thermoautotrophica TaxID=1469144 RepID=A0A132MMG9_9ACTN|nr:TetR family transcriptional regulator [Carbonactinospora thermoautotrophica]KWW98925.1 putative TetR-family transcriptional regulator [Carbonactinospora thermoautotrophica]KWX08805.1 TetR family transcriptional regulator [Carbonactinospora thermoautotrophica]
MVNRQVTSRRGPGRRPGSEDTRGQILAAALSEFAAHGYEKTSIRGIARLAGVDPALVYHYFGSKERVFVEALQFPFNPAEIVPKLVAGGVEGLGERIARLFFSVWEDPAGRERGLAVIRSVHTSEQGARMLRGFLIQELFRRVAANLDLPQPELRATLIGSQLVGLISIRYVLKVEPLASMPPEQLIPVIAPTLQRYLTDPGIAPAT